MIFHPFEEHLISDAVVQILARMDFIGGIDTLLVEIIEDRRPALGEFVEGGLDQPCRTLRKRIEERPGERAGEGRHDLQTEML